MSLDNFPVLFRKGIVSMFAYQSLYIICSWRPSVTVNQVPSKPFHWQLITMTVKKCFPDVQLQKENCFLSLENT